MRTIRNLISENKQVYVVLKTKAIKYRFMSDAEREGITYYGGTLPTERMVEDIMSIRADGTIWFLGWAGRIIEHNAKKKFKVDYEKYIDGADDYLIG